MFYDLIVVADFSPYKIGDKITDAATIAAIRASEKFLYCVQVLRVVVDTRAPVITTAASQSVSENVAFSLTLTADEPGVIWAKVGGADAALFTLVGATLTMGPKDFEAPTDTGGDNSYVVQVQATDTAGNASNPLTITVTVTDAAEGGGVAPTTVTLIAFGAL